MSAIDVGALFFWFILLLLIANGYSAKIKDLQKRKYFLRGLLLKIALSQFLCLVYVFYYGKGDTLYFFDKATQLNEIILSNISDNLIAYLPEYYYWEIMNIPGMIVSTLEKESTYIVVRITSIISFFAFESYYATTLIFATLSYIPVWKLFSYLYDRYKPVGNNIAIALLYIPSVCMFGSSILKDCITYCCVLIIVYISLNVILDKRYKISYLLVFILCVYLTGIIKSYILLCLLPSIAVTAFSHIAATIKNKFLSRVLLPFLLGIGSIASLAIINSLSETFTKFNIDNLEEKGEAATRWHSIRSEQTQGSGYSLGAFDPSLTGLVKKFPLAVNVTLFRPYLWETGNFLVLLAAFESLFISYLTVRMLVLSRGTIFTPILNDSFGMFSFIFSIMFAFSVGLVSYNFGALMRYKIPCIPFFIIYLSLVTYYAKQKQYTS